jgi:hypothetical protein
VVHPGALEKLAQTMKPDGRWPLSASLELLQSNCSGPRLEQCGKAWAKAAEAVSAFRSHPDCRSLLTLIVARHVSEVPITKAPTFIPAIDRGPAWFVISEVYQLKVII